VYDRCGDGECAILKSGIYYHYYVCVCVGAARLRALLAGREATTHSAERRAPPPRRGACGCVVMVGGSIYLASSTPAYT
jgi:hypothetical protein